MEPEEKDLYEDDMEKMGFLPDSSNWKEWTLEILATVILIVIASSIDRF